MRKMFSFQQYVSLNELRVHKTTEDDRGKFVSYQGNLWVFDDDEWEDVKDVILETLPIDTDTVLEYFWQFEQYIREEHPYILTGSYDRHHLFIHNSLNWRHSRTSKELQKVSTTLGKPIQVVYTRGRYGDEEGYHEEDFSETDIFYHGTCFSTLDDIFKKGLVPGKDSNFKVMHYDKVFVTNLIEKALFHANTAASKKEDFPVILRMTIPDPSKLVSDYDVVVDFKGTDDPLAKELGYDRVYRMATGFETKPATIENTKKKFDRLFGTYGYVGRITPTAIKDILIDTDTFEKFYIEKEIYGYLEDSYRDELMDEISELSDWRQMTKKELDRHIQRLEEENQYEEEEDFDED